MTDDEIQSSATGWPFLDLVQLSRDQALRRPALARKGLRSEVFEQASEFKEVGAGLQVGPNAFVVFKILGVTEEINALATFPDSFTLTDAYTAEEIVQLPLGESFRKRFAFP